MINEIIIKKNEYNEKKNNLKKLNRNETWESINNKIKKYINEN